MTSPAHIALTAANDQLLAALEDALVDLGTEQIDYAAPVLDERTIRDVAIHAYRPVLAVVTVVAGQPWPPKPVLPRSATELHTLLRTMHAQIAGWLEALPAAVLLAPVTVRWGSYPTGTDAIVGSLMHGGVHAGVIRGIRAVGGFPCPPEGSEVPA